MAELLDQTREDIACRLIKGDEAMFIPLQPCKLSSWSGPLGSARVIRRNGYLAFVLLFSIDAAFAQDKGGYPAAAIPVVQHWQVFSDPNEGAFRVEMPQGWKLSGGTVRHNALQFRNWASAISPDGATSLGLNDPVEPSYIAPSPLLAAAGFRVGSLYSGGGGTTYIIAPYETGVQFAVSWGRRKLQAVCSAIKVVAERPRADLSSQLNELTMHFGVTHDFGEATFVCDRNGIVVTAYAFTGTTRIGGPNGQGGLWYADTIEAFLAPRPVAGLAAGLLSHVVKSVQLNPGWIARQSQANMDVSRIATQTNAAISDSIMRDWQERGATVDRVLEEGSRARLGIDVYTDPVTGAQYTVANTHKYYWTNANGAVVGTDTDTAPSPMFRRLKHAPPQ